MKKQILRMLRWFSFLGFNPLAMVNNCRGSWPILREYHLLKRQAALSQENFPLGALYLCPGDRFAQAGNSGGHYFWQDLMVAQKIFRAKPVRHVDVGSRIDGFVAHVAAFREIEVFDIRQANNNIPNVKIRQADMMRLPSDLVGCCDSLSCLHALEHFGLGRYGDPIDFEGHLKGLDSLKRILASNGVLYLSVPIGLQRIEFNAHRVFSITYLLKLFESSFELLTFSYVDDTGRLHENVSMTSAVVNTNAGCFFGCGIFELRKRISDRIDCR